MTWCPLVVSSAVSAVPIRPPAPVTAIVRGSAAARGADLGGTGQRGQVGGELAMPVDEHGPQDAGGQRGLDHVGDQGGAVPRRAELVQVPPGSSGESSSSANACGGSYASGW